MRLSWNMVGPRLAFGAWTLIAGALVSAACSSDDFTSNDGTGGTVGSGGSAGSSGAGGRGGTAGSSGAAGAGGAMGRGGSGGSAGTSGGTNGAGGSSGSAGAGGASGTSGGGADGGGSAGTAGSGGTGGRGGTAGSSGTSGSAGSGGSAGSAGTGGTTSCRWGVAGACATGQYCNAVGCGDGTCVPVPAEGSTRNPVCGCDGLTYWNPSVAGHRGIAVRATGECVPARTCGGIASLECPRTDAVCNMKLMDSTLCIQTDPGGACWVLPAVCPSGPGIGPQTRACGAATCKSECELIKGGEPWHADNTCPT